jgi:hypothetical protein
MSGRNFVRPLGSDCAARRAAGPAPYILVIVNHQNSAERSLVRLGNAGRIDCRAAIRPFLPTERSGDMTDLTTTQMAGGLLDEFVRQYRVELEQLA